MARVRKGWDRAWRLSFYRLGDRARLQAENFARLVPVESGTLPPAIDLEQSGYNRNREPNVSKFQQGLTILRQALFERYLKEIYTTANFADKFLKGFPVDRYWIRRIFTKPNSREDEWQFWQFSARGRVDGVKTFADLDVFRGNEDDFAQIRR